MAKNDIILVDGIIQDRKEKLIPSDDIGEVFELLASELILKDYDLSNDEISNGSVDGRNDGGIDSAYLFCNGHLYVGNDHFILPKTNTELVIEIVSCKHHNTFKQALIDELIATFDDIFDLTKEASKLRERYNEYLLSFRNNFINLYRNTSPKLCSFLINVTYASRGDTTEIGEAVRSRAEQLKNKLKSSFPNSVINFNFFGSTEINNSYRKFKEFSLELSFQESLIKDNRYVILSKLKDFYQFICNDEGKLRRYLFDSNVRAFMGINKVNEDIKNTLENDEINDFWWLNNGITILGNGAQVVGKSINIQDIQIVNGLQTTESIYNYFSNGGDDKHDRLLLIKIIIAQEKEIKDAIIRATNNQTAVEAAALCATDKIQRDIEDILKRHNYYYERRTNYYNNQGIPLSLLISPLYLAAGYISLIQKAPYRASVLKSKFMRNPDQYNKIFSDKIDITIWPIIARILKESDSFLEKKRPKKRSTNRFLKKMRHLLSYFSLVLEFNKFNFSTLELLRLDLPTFFKKKLFEESFLFLNELEIQTSEKFEKLSQNKFYSWCEELAEIKGIPDLDILIKRHQNQREKGLSVESVSERLIAQVRGALPEQPWKPGVHKEIAKILRVSPRKVGDAINILIERKEVYDQKDGVVYGFDGKVIRIDFDRVNPETLKLF